MAGTRATPADDVVYELPLNERLRTLLRLEQLYAETREAIAGDSPLHGRRAVDSLLAILGVLSRGDLRTEIVQELERLATTLRRLQQQDGVDQGRLQGVLDECQRYGEKLRARPGQPGLTLKSDELLASVVQRSGVPGGTGGFDLPAYQYWLSRPPAIRRTQLEAWLNEFADLEAAAQLLLRVLRQSTPLTAADARSGVYQQMLERDLPYQMIRVALPAHAPYFPEISASKLFVNVRFLTQPNTRERPTPVDSNIDFQLACCVV